MSRSRSKGVQTSSSRLSFLWQVMFPPELLSKVFEYLTEQDRLNIRLTCRRWRDVCMMLRPRLWDTREFTIKGRHDEEVDRISGYLQSFGAHLKHLYISVDLQKFSKRSGNRKKTTIVQSRRVFSELKELLNANYQLNSFTFSFSENLQFFKTDQIPFDRSGIQGALCSMLTRQQHLSDVFFMDDYLSEEEGCQVLNALNSQLISLTLRNFFNQGSTAYSTPVFLEMIGRFDKLEKFGVVNSTFSDKLLEKLNNASTSFKRVFLFVEEVKKTPFSPPDWRMAMKKNPVLNVYVIMDVDFEQFPYQDFLLPEMPVISLTLDLDFDGDRIDDAVERELTHATRFITHYRLSIFILALEMSVMCPWNRPEALVALVKACPFLSHLGLDMTLARETLEQVAAAAHPAESTHEEAGEHSARPSLQIHVQDCDTSLERVMEIVSAVNPFCKVHICGDFSYLIFHQPLI